MNKLPILLFCLFSSAVLAETAAITESQSLSVYAARSRVNTVPNANSVYIDQQNNQGLIHIDQQGRYNKIAGLNSDPLIILGDNNSLTVKQGDPVDLIGKNLTEVKILGYNNQTSISQAINVNSGIRDGNESGGHYLMLNLLGNLNTTDLRQANAGAVNSRHYMNVDISGNSNNLLIKQSSNSAKILFGTISGDQNSINIHQSDSGAAFMNFSLSGNNHNLLAQQKNSGAHKSTITLINSGGAVTAEILQQGNTANNLSLYHNCLNNNGCTVSITQGSY